MSAKFDPVRMRRFWLELGLQHHKGLNLEAVPLEARAINA